VKHALPQFTALSHGWSRIDHAPNRKLICRVGWLSEADSAGQLRRFNAVVSNVG